MANLYSTETSKSKEALEAFTLVADEVTQLTGKMQAMVLTEVPKLTVAAQYFLRNEARGKMIRPTVVLLMASALSMKPHDFDAEVPAKSSEELCAQHRCIAAIIEMIHTASLIHDDVLDHADTRRGMKSLNSVVGNKFAVLSGDLLLSRAVLAISSLNNSEVFSLLATAIEQVVAGEIMQMTTTPEQRCSMEYYLQKSYCKSAALIANCCKAVALLAEQTPEVSSLAYQYGRNLGLAGQIIDDVLDFTGTTVSLGKDSLSDIKNGVVTAPLLFAMEEFPELRDIVKCGFSGPTDVDVALAYLGRSSGIERAREMAAKHAKLAEEAIEALPTSGDEHALTARRALLNLSGRLLVRTK